MTDIRLLRLRKAGMFSNVNEVVEQLRLAELGNYEFLIDWSASCYSDAARSGDPWNYYFETLFPDMEVPAQRDSLQALARGVAVACTRDNIITPRIRDGDCNPLLLPRDRVEANRLIGTHISINAEVGNLVEDFYQKNFSSHVIGLHIRGPGRTDGGVPELREKHARKGEVPLELFFEAVDKRLSEFSNAKIFACSDSSKVISEVVARYGDRVVTYSAIRSEFGEMHASHKENNGQAFDRHKLGMDVLVEALLLARSTYLIHGNSNVANFVLCKSPNLEHTYVLS